MPCCCETNVKAAFVLGIIFVVFSLVSCMGTDQYGGRLNNIISGIIAAVINGVLVYGAHTRNSTAILVWMILAIIQIIALVILAALLVFGIAYVGAVEITTLIPLIIFVVMILFMIWTVVVAKNARIEIKEEPQEVPTYQ